MIDRPAVEEPEPRPTRRASIFLGHETAARLLGLPEGMRIVGVDHDSRRLGVLFGVEADWLPTLLEGMYPVELGCGALDVETMVDDEGKTWCRWNWGDGKVADG